MKLEIKNITLKYDKDTIIKDQTIYFKEGKINTIIGKNGCGKSTIFKSLSKLIKPYNGNILLNNMNIFKLKNKDFAKKIGILFQENIAPEDLTVKKLISYGRFPHINAFSELSKHDEDIIEQSMNILDIDHLKDVNLCELSAGQKQMVWLATLLSQDTDILLLDEPTTYLDLKNQFQIMDCVRKINKELNKTIILILHDINLVSLYSDYTFMIKNKEIKYYGKTKDVLTKKNIKDIFEIEVSIFKDENKILICPKN